MRNMIARAASFGFSAAGLSNFSIPTIARCSPIYAGTMMSRSSASPDLSASAQPVDLELSKMEGMASG